MSAGVQDKPPQNTLLWYIGYVELKTLEKQQKKKKKRLSLNSAYLSKVKSSKRNFRIINPNLGSFIKQGRLPLITGEDTRN